MESNTIFSSSELLSLLLILLLCIHTHSHTCILSCQITHFCMLKINTKGIWMVEYMRSLYDTKSWFIGKRPWCWERLKAGGEEDDRGLDGWMASRTWHELEQAPGDGKETKQQQIYALVAPTRMLNPMGNIIVQALYSHFVPNYAECNAVTLSFNIQ